MFKKQHHSVKHGNVGPFGHGESLFRTRLEGERKMKKSLARKFQNKEAFNELNVSWVICSSKKGRKPESLYWFTQSGILFTGSEIAPVLLSHPHISQRSLWIVRYGHKDTQIAMLRRRGVRERRGGLRSRGFWSAFRSNLTERLSQVYSIEWFCI